MCFIEKKKSVDEIKKIYQLKINLIDTKPPIWRRILIESNIKLPDLHKIIQSTMGWTNSHLHNFKIHDRTYSLPDEDSELDEIDYRKVKLDKLIKNEGEKFYYIYDFGDYWEHEIELEKIIPFDSNIKYPLCIDGQRSCPPEDCGGTGGYERLLEIIKNPNHEEYKNMKNWLPVDFDPEYFNKDEINELLQKNDFGCITLFD